MLINAEVSNENEEAIPAQIHKFNGTETDMKHKEEKEPPEMTTTLSMLITKANNAEYKHILDRSDITGGQPFLLLCRCAEPELH